MLCCSVVRGTSNRILSFISCRQRHRTLFLAAPTVFPSSPTKTGVTDMFISVSVGVLMGAGMLALGGWGEPQHSNSKCSDRSDNAEWTVGVHNPGNVTIQRLLNQQCQTSLKYCLKLRFMALLTTCTCLLYPILCDHKLFVKPTTFHFPFKLFSHEFFFFFFMLIYCIDTFPSGKTKHLYLQVIPATSAVQIYSKQQH